jgi:hypothetical protein
LREQRTATQIRLLDGSVAVSLFLYVPVFRRLIEKGKEACNALSGFLPTLIGGQRDDIQFCEHRFASISSSPASYSLNLI